LIDENPLQTNCLLEKEFIDDMKLAINVSVFLAGGTITADVNGCFVVRKHERWLSGKEFAN
jgi:hypothetical protein